MIARLRFPELATPDQALPMILMHGLPLAVGTLGLAAVFSAELSAADAVLFMLTTSLSQDLYKRFVSPGADEQQVLRVARITTVFAGALGTALAIVSPTVIGALTIFYTLLGVSLFVPILGGLYISALATRHAMVAMVLGVGMVVVVHLATGGVGFGSLSPAFVGITAAVAGVAVMLAVEPKARVARRA
jgi:SSS family solute:Na+ symporter